MKIEILGVGCPKCKQLTANAEAAVKELNIQAEIGKVTDIDKITEYGVMMRAVQKLNEGGIKVYRAIPGTVADIVSQFTKGGLEEITVSNACAQHGGH